jgi:hypothetical protein
METNEIDAKKKMNDDLLLLNKMAVRLKNTLSKCRKLARVGEMTELQAKGAVIGRIENILSQIQEIKRSGYYSSVAGFKVPYKVISTISDANRRYKLNLDGDATDFVGQSMNDLETRANVPRGTAGFGYCRRCGRLLTNPLSVAHGIGPECIKKAK